MYELAKAVNPFVALWSRISYLDHKDKEHSASPAMFRFQPFLAGFVPPSELTNTTDLKINKFPWSSWLFLNGFGTVEDGMERRPST